jgi:hypothetical protein
MHNPLGTEGNFCDENGNALEQQILQGHNQHMWYTGKGDRMTNSYSIKRWIWKWKKAFFPPVNHDYCRHIPSPDIMWCKRTHTNLRIALVRNFIENAGSLPCPCLPLATSCRTRKVTRFNVNFSNFWPLNSSWIVRTVSHERYERECDVGLRIGECFKVYHKICKLWHTEECW